ncbi:MAG: FIST signal transduction protein [Candidatus Nitrospinota bacterium M3_3B_026]
MKVEQRIWTEKGGWSPSAPGEAESLGSAAELVLVFGGRERLTDARLMGEVRAAYPSARLAGLSTAGEILGGEALEGSLAVTAVSFKSSEIRMEQVKIRGVGGSHEAGQALASSLGHDGLRHVLVFADGFCVDGAELARGMWENLPYGVSVTGGLAADGEEFEKGVVLLDGEAWGDRAVAVGFYGDIESGFGAGSGWVPFGLEREVTGVEGVILSEFGGRTPLEIYENYLGDEAARLPASASMFPLLILTDDDMGQTRSVVAVNREDGSVRLNGAIRRGARARLMLGGPERLAPAASEAAGRVAAALGGKSAELALAAFGLGRRMILKQRSELELEAVLGALGGAPLAGFYSLGEICPPRPGAPYSLMSQSASLTVLRED